MAIQPNCNDPIAAALGKKPSKAKREEIESALKRNLLLAKNTDPTWGSLDTAGRLQLAANLAVNEVRGKTKLRKLRQDLDVVRKASSVKEYQYFLGKRKNAHHAVVAFLASVESRTHGVVAKSFTRWRSIVEAAEPNFLSLFNDANGVRDLVHEIQGKDSKNPIAKNAAKAWIETAEDLRNRLNLNGGDIGKLMYAYLPQLHDERLMLRAAKRLKAGKGVSNEDAWVSFVFDKLDREQYITPQGERMDDQQLGTLLRGIYKTISTNGAINMEPGKFVGGSSIADRHSAHRALHFKASDNSYLDYMAMFGKGTVLDAMHSHIGSMSRDIGLLETMGPNAKTTYDLLAQMAEKHDGAKKHVGIYLVTPQDVWAALSGEISQVYNRKWAAIGRGIRDYNVITKLQGTFLAALGDTSTSIANSVSGGLSPLRALTSAAHLSAEELKFVERAGVIGSSMISDSGRIMQENPGYNIGSKAAHATMKFTFVDALTDVVRKGTAMDTMFKMGDMAATGFRDADPIELARQNDAGITDTDRAIYSVAELEAFQHGKWITPESVAAIPDEKIDAVIKDRIDAIQDELKEKLSTFEQRDAQEQQWFDNRQEKLGRAEAKAHSDIEDLRARKTFEAEAEANEIEIGLEVAKAEAELAGVFNEIEKAGVEAARGEQIAKRFNSLKESAKRLSGDGMKYLGRRGEGAGEIYEKKRSEAQRKLTRAERSAGNAARHFKEHPERLADALAKIDEAKEILESGKFLKDFDLEMDLVERLRYIDDTLDQLTEARIKETTASGAYYGMLEGAAGKRLGEARAKAEAKVRELTRKQRRNQSIRDKYIGKRESESNATLKAMQAENMDFLNRMFKRMDSRQKGAESLIAKALEVIGDERQGARNRAVTNLLGYVTEESYNASINPGIYTRAALTRGSKAGTITGEGFRLGGQFLAFPFEIVHRAINRMRGMSVPHRIAYSMSLVAMNTLIAGAVIQSKNLLLGRDPQKMDDWKFAGQSFLAGGGLGIFGEMIATGLGGRSRNGQANYTRFLGPTAGDVFDALDITRRAFTTESDQVNGDIVRFAAGKIPFANAWFVKPALDHMLTHELQELVSPGYLRKMQSRLQQKQGQGMYWRPGWNLPERAPNFGAAIGEQ